MARLEEAMMYQEPETVYRTAQRQTMTNYAPPLCRRVDSDRRTPLGWWSTVGDLVGFTLLELLASPVLGIAVLVVAYSLDLFRIISDLCCQGANALNRKTRKAQE
ncbi:MAG: hypothetical protein F4X14_21750 [Caldilineaceae bacterium SB0661_bin_32]|uniref:Uncharacterized protein n=1 Tax=Caldilineaceae bacterium SB0661_bin_32 TaxID=2605255 RepID=A0A6B1DEA5_9CHLR|nr:hypothetical protein [Caldilineaceae bacterium SB0661_bin_32]